LTIRSPVSLSKSPGACQTVADLSAGAYPFPLTVLMVQQFGTFHVFYVVEHSDELGQVVAVDRTKIADIEAFKEVLLATKQRFDAIVETENKVFFVLVDEVFCLKA